MANSPYSIRLDAKVRKRLEQEAKHERRSAAFVVQEALEAYLNGKDYERRIAEEAFAEAEDGIFISGEKVHAWMESLGTTSELPFPKPDIFPESKATKKPPVRKAG